MLTETEANMNDNVLSGPGESVPGGETPSGSGPGGSVRESLSALMDGEAGELDLARALKHSGDPAARRAWARYHGVRSIIRQGGRAGGAAYSHADVSAGVMAAIAAEPAITAINSNAASARREGGAASRWRGAWRPLAGGAIAASVFAAVLSAGQFTGWLSNGGGPPAFAAADAPLLAPVESPTLGIVNIPGAAAFPAGYSDSPIAAGNPPPGIDYDRLARERLRRYLPAHTDRAALNVPQGMMPYARLASFQTNGE